MLYIDFETASTVDLKKVGAYKYATHPDTRIICMSYAFEQGRVEVWTPPDPFPFRMSFMQSTHRFAAWHMQFDRAIWNEKLVPLHAHSKAIHSLALDMCADVMATAAYNSLPLGLDQCADAVGLPFGKDQKGARLMKQMMRPRADGTWWHEVDPEKLQRLKDYCAMDVAIMRAIHRKLEPLPDSEQEIWEINERANEEGVCLDQPLINQMQQLSENALRQSNHAMIAVTGGHVPGVSQVMRLRDWLKTQGVHLPGVGKEMLQSYLDTDPIPSPATEAVILRLEAAKSSVAKLKSMGNFNNNGVAQGMIQYYGANRTGRFSGRGPQPHNYPRPVIDDPDNAVAHIKAGMTAQAIHKFYGPVLPVVSSCLRSCLVPKKNHIFISVDFSQIEARVIAWLAGQKELLDVFAKGEDIYIYTANQVGSDKRQLGKVLVLACGFGMGGPKFQETALTYGLKLSLSEALDAVKAWRRTNYDIVNYWDTIDSVFKQAMNASTTPCSIFGLDHGMRIERWKDLIKVVLPSGRELFYREPKWVKGEITYMGMNTYTHKWERIKTYGAKLVENIVQAVARDVLTAAMSRADANSWPPILTVHDELLFQTKEGIPEHNAYAAGVITGMAVRDLSWAQGLPIAAESWWGYRYRKG